MREGGENMQRDDSEDKQSTLEKIMDWTINLDETRSYVDKLRQQNPGITNDDLAEKIVDRKAFKSGLVGAVTGAGGVITLPVSVPANLVASWKIQATMAVAIACVYGHDFNTTDLKTDIYLIMAGNSAKEALKRFGIEATKAVTKKAVQKYITKEVMKKIWKVVGQKIITKAGQKSLTSFMKMVPIVGSVVGYFVDTISTGLVGEFAIEYYSGRG